MELNLFIQGCIAAIIIGVFYNLWASAKAYGGVIGTAIHLVGCGILFITVSIIERLLVNFSIIPASLNLSLTQDILNFIGLVFLSIGFSRLAAVNKS